MLAIPIPPRTKVRGMDKGNALDVESSPPERAVSFREVGKAGNREVGWTVVVLTLLALLVVVLEEEVLL